MSLCTRNNFLCVLSAIFITSALYWQKNTPTEGRSFEATGDLDKSASSEERLKTNASSAEKLRQVAPAQNTVDPLAGAEVRKALSAIDLGRERLKKMNDDMSQLKSAKSTNSQ